MRGVLCDGCVSLRRWWSVVGEEIGAALVPGARSQRTRRDGIARNFPRCNQMSSRARRARRGLHMRALPATASGVLVGMSLARFRLYATRRVRKQWRSLWVGRASFTSRCATRTKCAVIAHSSDKPGKVFGWNHACFFCYHRFPTRTVFNVARSRLR